MAAGVAMGGMDPQQQRAVMAALGAGAQYGWILPYGRNHETQADKVGLMLAAAACYDPREAIRSEEHTSELQSLMRISYAVFCLKKKKNREPRAQCKNRN